LIPQAYIQAWREHAPWPNPAQVEQDLIICRALCDWFNAPALAGKITFRGGTAIHKLLFKQPLRYSEDIDLVQTQAEPMGATVDAIRDALFWLGKCQREQAGHSMHLVFRFAPESAPQTALKLKVEINTREHEVLLVEERQDRLLLGRVELEPRRGDPPHEAVEDGLGRQRGAVGRLRKEDAEHLLGLAIAPKLAPQLRVSSGAAWRRDANIRTHHGWPPNCR